ncbi:hypothetical protein AURDEDRAFT_130047 [Auricularia subglabra TFB-10046 SS5]|uniref:Uncharacterized protein n=1 Tax=Auricularia subglabra (strain TFB-10046 / SS5) TaxID=717982 RepID=J0D9G6_AURST|nr:hypothetical protein AURDEDRAFT_130047 [Auricularia subglabra TFB-10046 SS5]
MQLRALAHRAAGFSLERQRAAVDKGLRTRAVRPRERVDDPVEFLDDDDDDDRALPQLLSVQLSGDLSDLSEEDDDAAQAPRPRPAAPFPASSFAPADQPRGRGLAAAAELALPRLLSAQLSGELSDLSEDDDAAQTARPRPASPSTSAAAPAEKPQSRSEGAPAVQPRATASSPPGAAAAPHSTRRLQDEAAEAPRPAEDALMPQGTEPEMQPRKKVRRGGRSTKPRREWTAQQRAPRKRPSNAPRGSKSESRSV